MNTYYSGNFHVLSYACGSGFTVEDVFVCGGVVNCPLGL